MKPSLFVEAANPCSEAYSGAIKCENGDCPKRRCIKCHRHLCPVCQRHYGVMAYVEDERGCCVQCVKVSTNDTLPWQPGHKMPGAMTRVAEALADDTSLPPPLEAPEHLPEEEWYDRTIANHAREIKYVDASEVPVDGLTGDDVSDWTKSGRAPK